MIFVLRREIVECSNWELKIDDLTLSLHFPKERREIELVENPEKIKEFFQVRFCISAPNMIFLEDILR